MFDFFFFLPQPVLNTPYMSSQHEPGEDPPVTSHKLRFLANTERVAIARKEFSKRNKIRKTNLGSACSSKVGMCE